jgi:hypothetical protein
VEGYRSGGSDDEEVDQNDSHKALFMEDTMDKELEGINIEFEWAKDIKDLREGKDWGATAWAHCAALNLIREAVWSRVQDCKIKMGVSKSETS